MHIYPCYLITYCTTTQVLCLLIMHFCGYFISTYYYNLLAIFFVNKVLSSSKDVRISFKDCNHQRLDFHCSLTAYKHLEFSEVSVVCMQRNMGVAGYFECLFAIYSVLYIMFLISRWTKYEFVNELWQRFEVCGQTISHTPQKYQMGVLHN